MKALIIVQSVSVVLETRPSRPKMRPNGIEKALRDKKGIKRHKALKGNDRNGLMKLFLAFFTKALQTRDRRTDRRTDGRTDGHTLL